MEWFKHSTGSHEDPDISEAWEEFGDAGPVVFWTILEVYGLEFNHLDTDGYLTLPIRYWERKLRRPWLKKGKTLGECWSSRGVDRGKSRSYGGVVVEFFRGRGRFEIRETPETVSIRIPKFIKIASNWTTRPKQQPTEVATEVATEAPHAIEVEEEEKKNNNTPLTPRKQGDEYESDFLTFWNAYPKKAKKPNAYREWKKLKGRRPGIEQLVGCIEKQRKWQQWREGYIPDPERWLKNERWNDEEPPTTGGNNGNGNRRTYPTNTYRRGTERDNELPPDVQRTIDEINRRSRERAAQAEADAADGRDCGVDPGA